MKCTSEYVVDIRSKSQQVFDLLKQNKNDNCCKVIYNGKPSQRILNHLMSWGIHINAWALESNNGDITLLGSFANDALATCEHFLLENDNDKSSVPNRHLNIIDRTFVHINVIRCSNKKEHINEYISNLIEMGLISNATIA